MNSETLATYFSGEKNGALVLVGMGVVMLAASILLFPARHELRALSFTLGAWSLLELSIGIGLFLKTDPQVAGLQTQLAADRVTFTASEKPRMEKVQRNFAFVQYVWVAFIVLGALIGWRLKESHLTVSNIALGFMINAAMFLAFEISAERRGAVYLTALSTQ